MLTRNPRMTTWFARFVGLAIIAGILTYQNVAMGQATAVDHVTQFRLTGSTITLPIELVRGYPFIEGEIAGVKGKLMLDTGIQRALTVNDHKVLLRGGARVGTGFFGSGQTFEVRRHATVKGIRVGNLRFPQAAEVMSQDARMLEGITPDFIGWIGYEFFQDYAMKLDYKGMTVTFYKDGPDRFLAGERIVATLPFETRKLPNHPILKGRIADIDAAVNFDTGMNGTLITSDAKKARLLASGHLVLGQKKTFNLLHINLAGKAIVSLHAIEVDKGPSPAAKPMGITEETEIEIGYALLKQFKTVWDFRQSRLYLLAS